MHTPSNPLPWLCLATLLLASAARAQDTYVPPDEGPSPRGVLIAAKGGIVLTTPRQVFPSVIIGDSREGSGEISSSFATTSVGYRFGLDLLFPFNDRLALNTDVGIQRSAGSYAADGARPALTLELQSVNVAGMLQGNLYTDPGAFTSGGVRAVYIGGGLDINVKMLANRLEGGVVYDSASPATTGAGSFQNNDPFRTTLGLRLASGARFGFDDAMEFGLEASYTFGLNPIFSSDVIRDNSYTTDHIMLQISIGHRF